MKINNELKTFSKRRRLIQKRLFLEIKIIKCQSSLNKLQYQYVNSVCRRGKQWNANCLFTCGLVHGKGLLLFFSAEVVVLLFLFSAEGLIRLLAIKIWGNR